LKSKSKSSKCIGFDIKVTNNQKHLNHDLKYIDLKSSPSLVIIADLLDAYIQGAAKKDSSTKLQYLQKGVIFLYEIFSEY